MDKYENCIHFMRDEADMKYLKLLIYQDLFGGCCRTRLLKKPKKISNKLTMPFNITLERMKTIGIYKASLVSFSQPCESCKMAILYHSESYEEAIDRSDYGQEMNSFNQEVKERPEQGVKVIEGTPIGKYNLQFYRDPTWNKAVRKQQRPTLTTQKVALKTSSTSTKSKVKFGDIHFC